MVEVTRRARRLSTIVFCIRRLLILTQQRLHRFRLPQARLFVLAVPLLNSLPDAPVNVFLDFDGHVQKSWGSYSNIVSPPFDQDGDVTTFSSAEEQAIREIWARVAEDYAPFNVNVTTVDPHNQANGKGVRVVVGGHYADWYRIRVGGVSFANSFVNSMPNVVYVFSRALSGGSPKYVADLTSHEVGHTFGLEEQSVYDESGSRVRDYNSGDSKIWGPLMGNSLAAPRSIWHYGTSTSLRHIQDDIAVIARRENGFGLRADDHGDNFDRATEPPAKADEFEQMGVIGSLRDADCFSINCAGGELKLRVKVADFGPNLDAKLELRSTSGQLLAYDAGDERLDCELKLNLPPGKYCAIVRSHGSYGDLGQYKLLARVQSADSTRLAILKPAAVQTVATHEPVDTADRAVDADIRTVLHAAKPSDAPLAGPTTQ